MSQFMMADRPVILSKHKRNVISHGKPLSPIGSLRSTSPFVPIKDSSGNEKHGDMIALRSPQSAPANSLEEYQKLAQGNLLTINNNLSEMLQETFSGIDSICQKVRLCLLEANTMKPPELFTLPANPVDINHSLSTCKEETESCATSKDAQELVDEILEETAEEGRETTAEENDEPSGELKRKRVKKAKRTPSITPFFTLLNPKTKSAESVSVQLIKSMTSKMGLSRKCTIQNFQESMKAVAKLTDYENCLTNMVENVNKEIDQCYTNYQRMSGDMKRRQEGKTNSGRGHKDRRPKSTPTKSTSQNSRSNTNDNIQDIKKVANDFTEDHFSDSDLAMFDKRLTSHNKEKLDYTYADVYRKRAITNLNKRMIAQVEANDSFIFFQKLMIKNRKYFKKSRPASSENASERNVSVRSPKSPPKKNLSEQKPRTPSDLIKKYDDSLWFRQRKQEPKKSKKGKGKPKKSDNKLIVEKLTPKSFTYLSSTASRPCTPKQKPCTSLQGSILLRVTTNSKKSVHKLSEGSRTSIRSAAPSIKRKQQKPNSQDACSTAPCKCKISVTNNQPLSESEKCKLHWMRTKYAQRRHKKLKYLDILDDITKNDLLPLKPEYPRRDDIVKITDVKESYLYMLLHGKGKETKKAWKQLLQPSTKCSKENCNECEELNVIQEKSSDKDANDDHGDNGNRNQVDEKSTDSQNDKQREEVIKTLSKYIFVDTPSDAQTSPPVFTVLPCRTNMSSFMANFKYFQIENKVHVNYDSYRRIIPDRRPGMPQQNLPLLPMKEMKEGVKKVEWTTDNPKNCRPVRITYDPLLKKIEKEIRMVSARHEPRKGSTKLKATNSWSPKNFNRFCTTVNPHVPTGKNATLKVETLDRSGQKQPQRGSVTISRTLHISEIYNKSSKSAPVQPSPTLDKFAKDASDVRTLINRDIEAHIPKLKDGQSRKIWENKYGKSAGQKLLNFIEKQPTIYEVPVPKYALPKRLKEPTKLPKVIEEQPTRHRASVLPKGTRQQKVLDQLRTLKERNDNIQNNIQKTIDVIEKKMIDILSKPTTSESIEAFEEMEQEITNVLSLMKTPKCEEGRCPTPSKTKDYGSCSDVNKISEELFEKLDKILESTAALSSRKSSRNSLTSAKAKKSLPPAKSGDMNQVCFSSRSGSGEEKFTVTGIYPQRSTKNSTVPPFMRFSVQEKNIGENDSMSLEVEKIRKERKYIKSTEEMAISEVEDKKTLKKSPPMTVKNQKVVPVKEQVVSLVGGRGDKALNDIFIFEKVSMNQKKESPSGDQVKGSNGLSTSNDTNQDEESVNEKGDSLSQTTTTLKEMQDLEHKLLPKEEAMRSEVTKMYLHKERPKTVEPKRTTETTEVSGPYFTPQTTPVKGIRDVGEHNVISPLEKNIMAKGIRDIGEQNAIPPLQENITILEFKEDDHATMEDLNVSNNEGDSNTDNEFAEVFSKDTSKEEVTGTERDEFYQNVNKIINRVESVYNQLEQFEEEMRQEELTNEPTKTAVPQEPENSSIIDTDAFLTPFMHAVKDLRKSVTDRPDSRKSSPRMFKSPSYYNVLSFLETLTDFQEEKKVIEVETSRIVSTALVSYTPTVFHHAYIQNQYTLSKVDSTEALMKTKAKISIETIKQKSSTSIHEFDAIQSSTESLKKTKAKISKETIKQKSSTSIHEFDAMQSSTEALKKTKAKISKETIKQKSSTSIHEFDAIQSSTEALKKTKAKISKETIKQKSSTSIHEFDAVQSLLEIGLKSALASHQISKITFDSSCMSSGPDEPSKNLEPTVLSGTVETPRKKIGCLKNSSISTVNANSTLRNKQKVSFLLRKEEKATQVSSCPIHSIVKIMSDQNCNTENSMSVGKFSKKDEQISVNLDVDESRSTNKTLEDDSTYQSTFEITDEVSLDKNQMPELVISSETQVFRKVDDFNDRKKNLAEILNNNTREEKKENVKVFYDTYKPEKILNKEFARGHYNEFSIQQVTRSLNEDKQVKKRESLQKLLKSLDSEILLTKFVPESSLLEPLKNINTFLDSKLLREAIESRQKLRMMRQKSACSLVSRGNKKIISKQSKKCQHLEKENLLKGIYVFVYLLMFTALNLEYKCVL